MLEDFVNQLSFWDYFVLVGIVLACVLVMGGVGTKPRR